MKTNANPKGNRDFLDDVVDEMGDEDGGTKYGADMEDDGDTEDGDDVQEDRIMAAKQVRKAITSGDDTKLAEALKAFVSTC